MKFGHFYSLPQSASLTAQFIVRLPPAIVCFDSLRDAPPTSEGAFRIGANLFAKLKFDHFRRFTENLPPKHESFVATIEKI